MKMKWGVTSSVIFLLVCGCCSAWGGQDKVKLEDVKVLTLKAGQMTSGRRSSPVPQLQCVGGSARCAFRPQVVQCYNKGSDGYDIQWECRADMDNAYRFGEISVSCEGYDYPEDKYVLKGSCGLEYKIELTAEGERMGGGGGYQSQQYYADQGSDYGWNPSLYKKQHKGNFITNLACGAVVVVIVYAIYKTCISPNNNEARQRSTTNDDYHGRGPGSSPPPPGFRSDYYPSGGSGGGGGFTPDDSCNANRNQGTGAGSSFGRNAGGFWTGAAAGGLLGYMFGNRNNNTHTPYGSATYRPRSSWGSYSSSSGSGYGSGGSSFGSSSGSRSSSGYGGTTRR